MDWDEALRLQHEEGWTYADIAREFGYAYETVREALRKRGAKPYPPSRARQTRTGQKLIDVWRFMRETLLGVFSPLMVVVIRQNF